MHRGRHRLHDRRSGAAETSRPSCSCSGNASRAPCPIGWMTAAAPSACSPDALRRRNQHRGGANATILNVDRETVAAAVAGFRDCRASGVRWSGHTLLMADWLIRTSRGWVEPSPPTCGCGSDRHLIGWQACRCGDGPVAGGHRTWECRECGERLAVGCAGRVGMGPMEEYGVRTGGGAKR